MQQEKPNKKRVDREKIQKRVVRFTLVIFFIATISAAGGFLQGERVANSSVNNLDNLAAITVTVNNQTYSFDGNKIFNNTKIIGEYSCVQSACNGSVSVSGIPFLKIPIEATCTGSSCTFKANGDEKPLDAEQVAELRRLTGVPAETPTASNPNPNPGSDTETQQANTEQCSSLETAGGECRNKCSTTYVKGQPMVVTDCGRSSGAQDNPVYKAIDKLNECIQQITGKGQQVQLDKAVCYVNNPAQVITEGSATDNVSEAATTASEDGKLYVPIQCLPLLQAVEDLKKAGLEKGKTAGSVSEKSGGKCAYNGAATCLFDTQTKEYNCYSKVGRNPMVLEPTTATQQSFSDCIGNAKFDISKITQCIQDKFQSPPTELPTQPPSPPDPDKPEREAPRAQCLIVASKEKISAGENVIVRWRTTNAESVSINGIGTGLSKSNQKLIKPSETTKYELLAEGKGKNNTKICEVTVVVDGVVDPNVVNAFAPRLSCSPSPVLKGKKSSVAWVCPASTSSSRGSGIDTKGKMYGEVKVKPKYNTEYKVACLDKNGEEVWKNVCAVIVGESKYDIIVYPDTAKQGDRVRISWASLFMKSCRVMGPRGFDYSKKQGVVIAEPFEFDQNNVGISTAVYNIECESEFGGRISKDVIVRIEE